MITKAPRNYWNPNTPDEYIRENEEVIRKMNMGHWVCYADGTPAYPEPEDARSQYLKKTFNWGTKNEQIVQNIFK